MSGKQMLLMYEGGGINPPFATPVFQNLDFVNFSFQPIYSKLGNGKYSQKGLGIVEVEGKRHDETKRHERQPFLV